jgi:hypothetical protein
VYPNLMIVRNSQFSMLYRGQSAAVSQRLLEECSMAMSTAVNNGNNVAVGNPILTKDEEVILHGRPLSFPKSFQVVTFDQGTGNEDD